MTSSPSATTLRILSDGGAAYGTAKAGMGIGAMGVMHPQLVMRNIIPVVMAGVLGIYGLIVSVILLGSSEIYFPLFISFICSSVAFPYFPFLA